MAKRKTKVVYRKAKTSFRKKVKSFASKPEAVILPAGIYGAFRAKAATALAPVLSKIPGGALADEVGMGIASYLLAKKGKGMLKKVGIAGLTIEAARAGEQLANNGFSMSGSEANTTNVFVN